MQEEDEIEEPPLKIKKIEKNPNVDTSFLFDYKREKELQQMKIELMKKFNDEQEKIGGKIT